MGLGLLWKFNSGLCSRQHSLDWLPL